MADTSRFDFCPKCGALARDGVCQSCGYQLPEYQPVQQPQGQVMTPQQPNQQSVQQPMQQPVYTQQPVQPVYTQQPVPQQPVPQQPIQQQPVPQQPIQQPVYIQQPIQQPYPQYMQAVPPEKKKTGTKKTAIIITSIIVVVLIALFAVIMLALGNVINKAKDRLNEIPSQPSHEVIESSIGEGKPNVNTTAKVTFKHRSEDVTDENLNEEGQDPFNSYYSGPYNAIDDSVVSYSIAFTKEYYTNKNNENILAEVEYPRLLGDNTYRKDINDALYNEYTYFEDLVKQYSEELTEADDELHFIVDSYVTYMDEELLSVVFKETTHIYYDGESFDSIALYCVNFDLVNGVIYDNCGTLNLDDDFVTDFRLRESLENGNGALDSYTDQEVKDMLNDASKLVLFFSPKGMEVGLNLDDRIIFVTYEDYYNYLK